MASHPLLLTLQSKCRSLTPFAHEDRYITEQDVSASDLLVTLEQCIFEGIRIKEFYGTFPFWYMLSLLPHSSIRTSLQSLITELVGHMTLQTAVAKSRGCIRLALNTGGSCLEDVLESILQHKKLLEFCYTPKSLLRRDKEPAVLLALVRSLKVLRFRFSVDSKALNKAPDWLLSYARGVMTGNVSSTQPLAFDNSIQTSLERGVGYFFRRLDDVAQELLLSQPSAASSFPIPDPFTHSALIVYDYGTTGNMDMTGSQYRMVDPPFFGTSLYHLLRAESRCRESHIARNIGVPNQLDAMLQALHKCVKVKGLFSRGAPVKDIQTLRLCLENEGGVPPNTSPHAVASCFLQWLYELPEPLLGFEMYAAFQACQRDIESEVHRLRNFSLLVDSSPWYNKPTLHRVMGLLTTLAKPENNRLNGLNMLHIANISAPFLMRAEVDCATLVHEDSLSRENLNNVMHVAAACGPVIEVLLSHVDSVFQPLSSSMLSLQEALTEKMSNISQIQSLSVQYITDISAQSKDSLHELWRELSEAENLLHGSEGNTNLNDDKNSKGESNWLQSTRWKRCFPSSPSSVNNVINESVNASGGCDVVSMFDTLPGGLLAVQSLHTFLKLNPSLGARLVHNFALRQCASCFLPSVSLNLTQMCLVELKLVSANRSQKGKEPTLDIQHISLEELAHSPSWHLLSHQESFAEIFGISLQIFDDLWKIADPVVVDKSCDYSISDREALFENCMVGTRILLNELLRKEPTTSEEIQKLFIELRISREPEVIEGLNLNHSRTKKLSQVINFGETDHVESSQNEILEHVDIADHIESNQNDIVEEKTIQATRPIQTFKRQPCILTADQIEALDACLPPEMRFCNWTLKYNLLEDGASIDTLVRQCKGVRRSIMVVQDTEGVVFGCVLCDDEWRVSHDNKYYGSGTVRVFSFKEDKSTPQIFSATLINSYFLFTSPEYMGVGGGGGGFAIYLDQDLNLGSSNNCETFNSPCLASSDEFVCMTCNVYSVEMS